MLDSLAVTLTPRGAELAARCLLRVLESFEGRQLATYGLIGVPLLQACVLHGKGAYSGLLVRTERKPHGSRKLIEGRLDPTSPVVMIDDSICSGFSMATCADRLEEAGLEVEGAVCLVRFNYDEGPFDLLDRGLRVASVFDIYTDFIAEMEGEVPFPFNPTKALDPLTPGERTADEGLHPAVLARQVIGEVLLSGRALRPPRTLDRPYDSSGGCWVSLRRRDDVYDRPAREGFWHFPGEASAGPAADVVQASLQVAAALREHNRSPLRTLERCAVAVTFFSELEACTVGDLDNDRYGIVVRSKERVDCMGGALPRMPGIGNEWQQFAHAWRKNAQLHRLEPFQLYRHDVEKVVEPGATWQPTGTPAPRARAWHEDEAVAGALAARAHRLVLAHLGRAQSPPPAAVALPPATDVDAVFLTLYASGRLAGCMGGPVDGLHEALDRYAAAVVTDDRFPPAAAEDGIAVGVSFLFDRHEIGVADPEWVTGPLRLGAQALEVRQGERGGLLLPFWAVMHNLSPLGYVEEVIDKAGITRPPYHWTRYECASWLADGRRALPLVNGLPEGSPAESPEEQAERLGRLLLRYTRRHHVATGRPFTRYEPFADRLRTDLHPARLAYGAWVKARARLRRLAHDDVARLERAQGPDGWVLLGGEPASVSELAFLSMARGELGGARRRQEQLASVLWGVIDLHGRIATHRDHRAATPEYQDYAPGQVLLALASAAERGETSVETEVLHRALRHYRMRFHQNHHWGAVAWLTQAFTAWGRLLRDPSLTEFAFEVADWAGQFQSVKTGGFLNDHQDDSPGVTTALYAEGFAATTAAASAAGDHARADRYRTVCERAFAFLDQLVYQRRDLPVLPNPDWAIGGIRTSLTASEVRLDYVHHALAAVLALRSAKVAGA